MRRTVVVLAVVALVACQARVAPAGTLSVLAVVALAVAIFLSRAGGLNAREQPSGIDCTISVAPAARDPRGLPGLPGHWPEFRNRFTPLGWVGTWLGRLR